MSLLVDDAPVPTYDTVLTESRLGLLTARERLGVVYNRPVMGSATYADVFSNTDRRDAFVLRMAVLANHTLHLLLELAIRRDVSERVASINGLIERTDTLFAPWNAVVRLLPPVGARSSLVMDAVVAYARALTADLAGLADILEGQTPPGAPGQPWRLSPRRT